MRSTSAQAAKSANVPARQAFLLRRGTVFVSSCCVDCKVSCSFIEIPFCLHGDTALALEGELARGLLVNAGDGNRVCVVELEVRGDDPVLIVEVHDFLPCGFGDRRVMDGAPLGEGGDDGLLIPAEEFRDLAVHALHGNVCHRFGTLVCGVFLSEHRRACKGGDGVLTGGLRIGVHRSATAVRVNLRKKSRRDY